MGTSRHRPPTKAMLTCVYRSPGIAGSAMLPTPSQLLLELPVITGFYRCSLGAKGPPALPPTPMPAARLGPSDLAHLLTVGGRLFLTEASTPCKEGDGDRKDLWFSPHRDREQAARRCLACPFLGRCGYNAVISR